MNYTFFIARRYFRRKKGGYLFLTNLFAIISVAVGVAALLLVLGVMNGFEKELKSRIIGILPPVMVHLPEAADHEAVAARLLTRPEVTAVSAYSETQAILSSAAFLSSGLVRAVDAGQEDRVTGFKQHLVAVSDDIPLSEGALIGQELAYNLRLSVDDRLELVTGFGMAPYSLPVAGIFRTGHYHFDVGLVLVPLARSRFLFPNGGRPESLGVGVTDVYQAGDVARRIAGSLPEPGFRVESWIDRNQALFAALALERKAMAAILVLIILVAGFNIATSLMITIWRKTREIGTLRSLGVSAGGIRSIFLWMGLLTGLCGVGAGLVLGLSLAFVGDHYQLITLPGQFYDLTYLPIRVKGSDVAWISAVAFTISLLASFFPARQAGRVMPAITLRSE